MSRKEWTNLYNGISSLLAGNKSKTSCQDFWGRFANTLGIYRYPKSCYNASTSTLIIKRMRLPVHESIMPTFCLGSVEALRTSQVLVRMISSVMRGQTFEGFERRYSGSLKVSDLALVSEDVTGLLKPKFILEAGPSETYKDLIQDVKRLIEGNHNVYAGFLRFEETPKYQRPVPYGDNIEIPSVAPTSCAPSSRFPF